MSAAFTKAGGKYFVFGEAEAVTYQVDAPSWKDAVEEGLENCSTIVWKHGKLLERFGLDIIYINLGLYQITHKSVMYFVVLKKQEHYDEIKS